MSGEWKFDRTDGMPKGDGARAFRYWGFDADNAAYILRWSDLTDAWIAVGFDQRGEPVVYALKEANAELIQSHAAAPLRWSEMGLPAREQPLPGFAP